MGSSRREFLQGGVAAIAGLAAGCERMKDSSARPTKAGPTKAVPAKDSKIEIERVPPQQQPGPLVFGDGRLGQLRNDALAVRRVPELTEELVVPVGSPYGVGALSDGSLVILEAGADRRIMTLAPGSKDARSYRGYVPTAHGRQSWLFAGPKADSVVVATRSRDVSVDLYRLVEPDKLEPQADFKLEADDFKTLTALDGGTLAHVTAGRGLARVGFGRTTTESPLQGEGGPVVHLVAGPTPATAWLSRSERGLFLVSVADPARNLAKVTPKGGEIYHLARAGSRVAALLIDQGGARKRIVSLAVFDDKAAEVWRTTLALPDEIHFVPRWVAGSDKHVAVGHATELAVFDAATGKKLA